ncbi:MAG TPA: hypothetical protein VM889_04175 [Candidatus Thermoplasmatota archaeon]|nr:hypothetical protein [Candidatus Thermoplasmatota archaeon]
MQTALKLLVVAGVAFAPALAGCLNIDPDYITIDVTAEVEEPLGDAFAIQKTCVAEARFRQPSSECSEEATDLGPPTKGIRILDAMYIVPAPNPRKDPMTGEGHTDVYMDVFVGTNPHRASDGLVADTILPGWGTFVAAHGWWDNLDEDAFLEVRRQASRAPLIDNEWRQIGTAKMYSYVEPGPHPTYASFNRPESFTPDFKYVNAGAMYRAASATDSMTAGILFVDGSLFQTLTIMTVTDPILAPSEDGKYPFIAGARSLVDIDVYSAQSPGPITTIFASTAAPFVNAIGSPNVGTCPNACRVEPARAPGSGLEPALGLQGAVYGRYLPEWREGSGSSAENRRDDFNQTYRGWIDLMPRTQQPTTAFFNSVPFLQQSGALVGGSRGGEMAAAPSFVTFELWAGIWHDVNEDGHVGVASQPDPYEGGSRPVADDYFNNRGEFNGIIVDGSAIGPLAKVHVRVTPDAPWSAGTMKVMWSTNQVHPNDCGPTAPTTARVCSIRPVTGMDTVLLNLTADAATLGRHYSAVSILVPPDSPGFTMCAGPFEVRHDTPGHPVTEPVWDCDHVAAWTPRAD